MSIGWTYDNRNHIFKAQYKQYTIFISSIQPKVNHTISAVVDVVKNHKTINKNFLNSDSFNKHFVFGTQFTMGKSVSMKILMNNTRPLSKDDWVSSSILVNSAFGELQSPQFTQLTSLLDDQNKLQSQFSSIQKSMATISEKLKKFGINSPAPQPIQTNTNLDSSNQPISDPESNQPSTTNNNSINNNNGNRNTNMANNNPQPTSRNNAPSNNSLNGAWGSALKGDNNNNPSQQTSSDHQPELF